MGKIECLSAFFCFSFTNQDKCGQMANTMNIGDRWLSALTSVKKKNNKKKQVRDVCELAEADETHPGILNEVAEIVPASSVTQRVEKVLEDEKGKS